MTRADGPRAGGAPWPAVSRVTASERAASGREARARIPRAGHAAFEPAPGRDPIALLAAQEVDRLADLLPLRHARMAASPFAYYRGAPAVMAFDLSSAPCTGITVQASGDAHLLNFGLFASPERTLVFDANDFDETLPGPWEWDVKRLAASVVVVGAENGFAQASSRKAAMIAVRAYRTWIARYASMRLLDVRYAAITSRDIAEAFERSDMSRGRERAARRRGLESVFSRARGRDQLRAFASLTAVVGGRRVIVDDPPVVLHEAGTRDLDGLRDLLGSYRATVDEDRRDFLGRFHLVDAARKVVGVGSVGTRCSIVVLEGRDEKDPLILQVKEAEPSVLEPYLAPSGHAHQGERVVVGQRVVQATPDPFLGWATDRQGRHFYVRQLWDMKGSADPTTMAPNGLRGYAALCGWSLARAHARSGDAVAIAAYLGTGDVFDGAVADFAEAYARQNALDHAAYVDAIRAGRVDAGPSST